MRAPRWARVLLRLIAPAERADEVLGDLEEAHRVHLRRRGRLRATLRTTLETLDMACALLRGRVSSISLLDFKLGFRMLVRYPGLTLVAGVAIAFAIAAGSGTVQFASDFLYPTLPFEQGERILEIRNQNVATGAPDRRALHDFELWRQEAHSVVEMGAFRNFRRNLVTDQGRPRPVAGAEMTAAAFGLPRVPPYMGRPLAESDERPGTPEVAVIGYDVWKSSFEGDPEVVGTTIRLGTSQATVVGVMPPGFAYPLDQDVWTPLRLSASEFPRGEGPAIEVVARLAPGASLEEARAEFAALGLRTASNFPETHQHLRPRLIQFGRIPELADNWLAEGFYFGLFFCFCLLMLLVCANVALLLFARTTARESEITVRAALGATRGRIVAQLSAEALVLALASAGVGLWGGHLGLKWILALFRSMGEGGLIGFWFGAGFSPGTVGSVLLLTVLAAGMAGVVPALRVTGRGIQPALQRTGAGRGVPGFGRFWTLVIVTQIALTVAFIPVVIVIGYQTAQIHAAAMGFEAQEYLSVRLVRDPTPLPPGEGREADRGGPAPSARAGAAAEEGAPESDPTRVDAFQELKRRLAAEPWVRGVAMASNLPGANHPLRYVEMDGPSAPSESSRGHRVATGSVDPDFFEALGVPILSGRSFRASDLEPGRNSVVVNEDFARFVLEERNPVGRSFTYVDSRRDPEAEPGPRYEIIGVVQQVAMQIDPDLHSGAGVYHPLAAEGEPQVIMAIHVGPNPASHSQRLYRIAADVDPGLLLYDLRPMDEGAWVTALTYESWFRVILAAGGIGLLLALAGIYSIMAFTVSRRTREIGVRVALGADRKRVVVSVFSRAFTQVGIGVVVGGLLFLAFVLVVSEGTFRPGPKELLMTAAYMSAMLGVCMLACIVPTRRALAIQPTEALRAEG